MKIKLATWKALALLSASMTLFALALSVQNSHVVNNSKIKPLKTKLRSQNNKTSRQQIEISKRPNIGYDVHIAYRGDTPSLNGKLVAINTINIKGKSLKEIKALLRSPIGSPVTITFVNSNDSLDTATVYPEPIKRTDSEACTLESLKNYNRLFNGEQNNGWPEVMSTSNSTCVIQNLDLHTLAANNLIMRGTLELPEPKSVFLWYVAAEAAMNIDKSGALPRGDNYISRLFTNTELKSITNRNYDEHFEEKLLSHLITTGRLHECEIICKQLLEESQTIPTSSNSNYAIDSFRKHSLALRKYALCLAENGSPEAVKVAQDYFSLLNQHDKWTIHDGEIKSLADKFQLMGDYKSARTCYEFLNPINHLMKLPPGQQQIESLSPLCDLAYRLAMVQDRLGYTNTAIEILDTTLNAYKKGLSTEQQNNAEKIGLLFPTGSDLELQLAKLDLKQGNYKASTSYAQSAINRVKTALGDKAPQLKPILLTIATAMEKQGDMGKAKEYQRQYQAIPLTSQAEEEPTDSQKFALVRSAYLAIKRNDTKATRSTIRRLQDIYVAEEPSDSPWQKKLNLYCALLGLSRKLADAKQYSQANDLLDFLQEAAITKEQTPAAARIVTIDKALTAILANANNNTAWRSVDNELSLTPRQAAYIDNPRLPILNPGVTKTFQIQENLRLLAELYCAADEPARAEILITRAQNLSAKLKRDNSPTPDIEIAFTRSRLLLLLDAAIIKAKGRCLQEAKRLTNEALALCSPSLLSEDTLYLNNCGKICQSRMVQLAQIYVEKQHAKEAINLLKDFYAKADVATLAAPLTTSRTSYSHRYRNNYGQINAYLAKLLLKEGKPEEAKVYCDRAFQQYGNSCPTNVWLLTADIAIALKDYGQAAHAYSEAELANDYSGVWELKNIQPNFRTDLLRKAHENALKLPNFDKTELTNIALRLGSALSYKNPKEALALLESAYALLPDNQPRKVGLSTHISNLKSTIAAESMAAQRVAKLHTVSTKSPPQALAQEPLISAEETQKLIIASAKSKIPELTQQALLAERTKRDDAARYWLRLAEAEVSAKFPDKGIEHARHGINQYKFTPIESRSDPLIPGYYGIVNDLANQNKAAEAESLLKEASEKIRTLHGPKSSATARQMTQQFNFYLKQNMDAAALNLLDQILAIDPRVLEVGIYSDSPLKTICTCANGIVDKPNKASLALTILEKVLRAQQKTFMPDDCRLADTRAYIGKAEYALGNYRQAESNLHAALAIHKLYMSESDALLRLTPVLTPVLTKLGKLDEVKNIEALIQTRRRNWTPDYIDPVFHHDRRRAACTPGTPPAIKIKELKREYQEAFKQAPYSPRTCAALELLTQLASREKDWPLLANAAAARCQINEHQPDDTAGRFLGCVPPRFRRLDFYQMAWEANLNQGNRIEAKSWIERAAKNLPELSMDELICMAKAELKLNNPTLATAYLTNATSLYNQKTWQSSDLAGLWQKLGRPERAQAVLEKEQQIEAQYKKTIENASSREFRNVGW